jgi:hypothetical protein
MHRMRRLCACLQLTKATPSKTGAANIGDAGTPSTGRADKDVVPEAAVRPSRDEDHHTGRGGAGNTNIVAKVKSNEAKPAPTAPVGLADLLKKKIFGVFKK